MLASRHHRLRHTVWHTLRADWFGSKMTDKDRDYLKSLRWGLDDPPFNPNGTLNLANGAGVDFLFMHRHMISMHTCPLKPWAPGMRLRCCLTLGLPQALLARRRGSERIRQEGTERREWP